MFSNHLSFETIADLVEGKLAADANGNAANHIKNCLDCAKIAEELGSTIGLMRSDKMEDAPDYAIKFAFNIMPRKAIAETPSLLQKIAAALSFDSATFTPAYGVRSGATAKSRQLIFNADEMEIDLRVTQQGINWVISGQILGECENGWVELTGENAKVESAINELCEFKLPPIKAGSYFLKLVIENLEIELPQIVVK